MTRLARAQFICAAALSVSAHAVAQDRILVAGYFSNNVLSFDASTFEFESEVLGVSAGASLPYAALLRDDRLFVCDWSANSINEFAASSGFWVTTISSFGGAGAADLPAGLAFGADGALVVSSSRENVLRRFNVDTTSPLGVFVGASAGLLEPDALIRASTGHFLVCSRGNHSVFRISADGMNVERLIWDDPQTPGDPTGGLQHPQGIAERGGTLLVSSGGTHSVLSYRASDGAFTGVFVSSGLGGLFDPRSIGVLPSGEVLVASHGTNTVKRYGGAGAYLGEFGQNAPYDLSSPTALIVDAAPPALLIGDTNCDGTVSVGDIGPFVMAITNPAGYSKAFPNCDMMAADCSGDGAVTVGDIGPFVSLVVGG